MKSIKEKAKEYAKTKHTNQNLIEIVSWDFEAGANYVISCIEKEMLSCKKFSQSQLRLIIQFCEKLETTNK
jgi:hypothetical protein